MSGPRTFRALVNHYGGARAALAALPDLARRGGANAPPAFIPRADAERELAAAAGLGVVLVALGEPDYPARLRRSTTRRRCSRCAATCLLWPSRWSPWSARAMPRRPASKFAERLARELGEAGFVIVSGLARGIDAAAHRASVATGTVAVLAGGHDRIYPAEHARCWKRSSATGPRSPRCRSAGSRARRDFPRRNRLISGLSLGVVIVEAARRSGSLITARLALEQGREVFAVPGSPLDPRAEGTNGLLKQGATLVTEAADVLAVLQPILGRRPICRQKSRTPPHRRPSRAATSATASSRCSVRPRSASTTWSGCRNPPPPSCAPCCSSSRSPAGLSATAAVWSRWCKLALQMPGSSYSGPLTWRRAFSASSLAMSRM